MRVPVVGPFIPALMFGLLPAGIWPDPAFGQEAPPRASVEDVEREIRSLRRALQGLYEDTRYRMQGYVPPACDPAAGEDCLLGDPECLFCLTPEHRTGLRRLAVRYDTVAALAARADPGVHVGLLDWLAGQRVRVWSYLEDQPRIAAAVTECLAREWWCETLRGLVEQRAGHDIEAHRHFEVALRMMPANLACYWNEFAMFRDSLAWSVGHPAAAVGGHLQEPREWGRVKCASASEVRNFWTLADPLWSRPGNDRLAEHYARHADMQVHRHFLEMTGNQHPLSHHSTVTRLGWPTGLTHVSPTHDRAIHGPGQSFVVKMPLEEALRASHSELAPGTMADGEIYGPAYGPVAPLPLQTGFFRRDGKPTLVVRAAMRPENRPALDAWMLIAWDGESWRDAPVVFTGDTMTAWLDTPWRAQIVSLEAMHDSGAWRARSGTIPPDSAATPAMSSVILLDATSGPPDDLGQAVRRMLPTLDVATGSAAAAYWEVYADQPYNAQVEVVVRRVDERSTLSRLIGRATPPALRVAWQESIDPVGGVARRSIDFGADRLDPGPHVFTVRLVLHTGAVLTASSPLEILDRD